MNTGLGRILGGALVLSCLAACGGGETASPAAIVTVTAAPAEGDAVTTFIAALNSGDASAIESATSRDSAARQWGTVMAQCRPYYEGVFVADEFESPITDDQGLLVDVNFLGRSLTDKFERSQAQRSFTATNGSAGRVSVKGAAAGEANRWYVFTATNSGQVSFNSVVLYQYLVDGKVLDVYSADISPLKPGQSQEVCIFMPVSYPTEGVLSIAVNMSDVSVDLEVPLEMW